LDASSCLFARSVSEGLRIRIAAKHGKVFRRYGMLEPHQRDQLNWTRLGRASRRVLGKTGDNSFGVYEVRTF
jgi:hypothetical protein